MIQTRVTVNMEKLGHVYRSCVVTTSQFTNQQIDDLVNLSPSEGISVFNRLQILSDLDPDAQAVQFDHETCHPHVKNKLVVLGFALVALVLVGHWFKLKLTECREITLILRIWMHKLYILVMSLIRHGEKQAGNSIVHAGDACSSGSLVRTQTDTVQKNHIDTHDLSLDLALQGLVLDVHHSKCEFH